MKFYPAAEVKIHCASKMTDEGRRDIAVWLRQLAISFKKNGGNYAPNFSARFLYRPSTKHMVYRGNVKDPKRYAA